MASSQLGVGIESTYGTGVAVDKFLPFRSSSMDATPTRLDDPGNVPGSTIINTSQLALGRWDVGGSLEFSVFKSDIAHFFYHALGVNADTGADPYTHTMEPGSIDGLGLTVQEGIPDLGATPVVNPFSYTGCKVQQLSLNVGDTDMTLGVDLVGQDYKVAADGGVFVLQTATLPTLTRFQPTDFAFTMDPDGVSAEAARCVRSFSLNINNTGLITDRYCLGTSIRKEPLLAQGGVSREITGTIEMEWDFDVTLDWSRYVAQTITDATLTIDDGTYSITATMDIETMAGAKPQMTPSGLIYMSLDYRCVTTGGDDQSAFEIAIVDNNATV